MSAMTFTVAALMTLIVAGVAMLVIYLIEQLADMDGLE